MSDELQKIGYGSSRNYVTTANCPAREPVYNDGATGKEVIINYNSNEYHLPTEERLSVGNIATPTEVITSGTDVIGVLGAGFAVLPTETSLTAVLNAIDTSLSSVASGVILEDGSVSMLYQWHAFRGIDIGITDSTVEDNEEKSITNIGGDLNVFNASDLGVDVAPSLISANWDDSNDWNIGTNIATYTHSAGFGLLSFNTDLAGLDRASFIRVEYTITNITGDAENFNMFLRDSEADAYTKNVNINIDNSGVHVVYFYIGNPDFSNSPQTLYFSVDSVNAGSFRISNIVVQQCEESTLITSKANIAGLDFTKVSHTNGVNTVISLGQRNHSLDTYTFENSLKIVGGIGNGEFTYLEIDELLGRTVLNSEQILDLTSDLISTKGNTNLIGDVGNFINNQTGVEQFPAIGGSWADSGDFVVSPGVATYTHNTGTGALDVSFIYGFLWKWVEIVYRVTNITGAGADFDLVIDINGKTYTTTDGDHYIYMYVFDVDAIKLTVNSVSAGSFEITILSMKDLSEGTSFLTNMTLGNVATVADASGSVVTSQIHGSLGYSDAGGVNEYFGMGGGWMGFHGHRIPQPPAITNPTGGAVIDAEARTSINSILGILRDWGLIDT